jgi:hypothetical protein
LHARVAARLRLRSLETRRAREELHHATHGLAAVKRRARAANCLDALQIPGIHQRYVLVRRVAEDRVVEPEAIDQVQHFRALESPDDRNALPGSGLLHVGARLAAQVVHDCERRVPGELIARHDGHCLRDVLRRCRCASCRDLHDVQCRQVIGESRCTRERKA